LRLGALPAPEHLLGRFRRAQPGRGARAPGQPVQRGEGGGRVPAQQRGQGDQAGQALAQIIVGAALGRGAGQVLIELVPGGQGAPLFVGQLKPLQPFRPALFGEPQGSFAHPFVLRGQGVAAGHHGGGRPRRRRRAAGGRGAKRVGERRRRHRLPGQGRVQVLKMLLQPLVAFAPLVERGLFALALGVAGGEGRTGEP
jgi:hypothetical protein